jgi:hypothetical protein
MDFKIIKRVVGEFDKRGPWPEKCNLCFAIGSIFGSSRRAVLIYQRWRKLVQNGWEADHSPNKFGWNFTCADLLDEEDNDLAFGHLIKGEKTEVFYMHFSKFDKKKVKTMLQFGMEVIKFLELHT